MSAQLTQIHPLVFIRRNRFLPVPGTINVRSGQKVDALDVVADVKIPTRHYIVDVFRSFRLKTATEADKLVERKPGEMVEKNDIIAETGGTFSKVIRTPGPGRVVSITSGKVLIEAESRHIDLLAGISGTVTQIISDRGVTIEVNGALVQGVWGNGKVGKGLLVAKLEGDSNIFETVDNEKINPGAVILAETCTSEEVLKSAALSKIAGLILGSISSALISAAEEQPYPIVVLGGFGKFGVDPISKKLLLSNVGREVSLIAVKWNRLTGERPEVIIPLPANGEPYKVQANFAPGQTVRVHSSVNQGKVGLISKVFPELKTMPGGLRCNAAAVKFSDGVTGIIPLTNLEIIDLMYRSSGETEEGG